MRMHAAASAALMLAIVLLGGCATTPKSMPTRTAAQLDAAIDHDLQKHEPKQPAALADAIRTGQVGVTWQGAWAAVKPPLAAPLQKLLDDQNIARTELYASIARGLGTTPEHVAQRYAVHVFDSAPTGEYLQYQDGIWRAKS